MIWNQVVERTLELHEAAQQLNRKGGGGRWRKSPHIVGLFCPYSRSILTLVAGGRWKHHAKASDAWHSTRRPSASRPSAASVRKSLLRSDFLFS